MPKNPILPWEKFRKKNKCEKDCGCIEPKCKKKTWLEKKTDARIRLFNNEIPPKKK